MKHGWLRLVCHVCWSLLLMNALVSCSRTRLTTASSTAPAVRPTGPVATPTDADPASSYIQYGTASWYGPKFHGRRTANGEVFDMFKLTAAHKFVPLGVHAIVTNLDTGRSVRVRINDRGPFAGDRILDLSYAAARRLKMVETGLARVKIRFLPETIPIPTFVVQAGSYTNETNAIGVQRALAAQYPNVWIALAETGSQTFYRVWVGTFSSRAAARRAARAVQLSGYAAKVIPLAQPPTRFKQPAGKL